MLKSLSDTSVGLVNFIAAFLGITVSFLGSRYFVFRAQQQSVLHQIYKFGVIYILIAVLHGLVLYAWSDLKGWDYRTGFLLATALQMLFSYWGNKLIVFRE
jgi:putative flippase GtrA